MSRVLLLLAVFAGVVGEASQSIARDDSESRLALKSSQVVIFKDGYALVVKEASGTTDAEGKVHTYDVPDAAILGSFWAVGPKGQKIKSMVAGWERGEETISETVNCESVADLLAANVGRDCSFLFSNRPMQGKILKMLVNETSAVTGTHASRNNDPFASVLPPTRINRPAKQFLLRTKLGDTAINIASVQNLTIEEMVSTHEAKSLQRTNRKKLTFDFGEKNQDVNFKLMYFRPDVRWIPTYRIELTEKDFEAQSGTAPRKTARIALQGEILNEAEDLVDVPLHLVVGVPNFRFRKTPSPMTLETKMKFALVQAAPQIMGQQFDNNAFSNAMYTQRASEFRSHRAEGGAAPVNPELMGELSGKASQDLFVYELEPMTLKKGERACVPILTESVGYRDVYTWDMQIKHSESFAATTAEAPSPLVLSENKVWRQVELINDTKLPWTTGAAVFVEGFQPLAQELLTYTSPGGICRVPVTVAVDLRGKVDDREVDRELKAMAWRGRNYAKIKGRVSAELANNKQYSVPVEVTASFGGKAVTASDEGEVKLLPYRREVWSQQADVVNNSSRVIWKTEIKPGECFKPTIDYEFFTRY